MAAGRVGYRPVKDYKYFGILLANSDLGKARIEKKTSNGVDWPI